MRVANEENIRLRQELKGLKQKIQKQIANQRKEFDQIKTFHRKRVVQTNDNHQIDMDRLRKNNEAETIKELKKHQGRLEEIKKDFENTKSKIEAEKKQIKTDHDTKMEALAGKMKISSEKKQEETNEFLNNLRLQTKEAIADAMSSADYEIRLGNQQRSEKINDMTTRSENQIKNKEMELRRKQMTKNNEFVKNLAAQKLEHQNRINQMKFKYKKQMNDQKRVLDQNLQSKTDHYKKVILNEDRNFRQKIDAMKKAHRSAVASLKKMFKKEIGALKSDYSFQKRNIDTRAQDRFYRIEALRPEIVDKEKEYHISLKVPAHEEASVHLTAMKRKITIGAARRFEDELNDDNGGMNRTRRSEVFSNSFHVKDIIDPRQISRHYNKGNGTLTFKLKKA